MEIITLLKRVIVGIIGAGMLAGCACETLKDKGYDTKAIAQAVKNRNKLKHIKEEQLISWMLDKGKLMSVQLQKAYLKQQGRLQKVQDSLTKTYAVEIKQVFWKDSTQLTGKPKEVFQAYLYAQAQDQPLQENVQVLSHENFLFSQPFQVDNQVEGVWLIYFSRKEAVLRIDPKELKP